MEVILEKIEHQMAEGLYFGASISVFKAGKWQSFYLGTQDGCEPVRPGLVYDLASVSKVVGVATVMAFLYEEGSIDLDSTLRSYLPMIVNKTLTLRQLLTHTSGINPYIPNRDLLSYQELKEAIYQIEVTPNKEFHYTDINFILLGFLLEHLWRQSLSQIFEEKIFTPWRMTSTSFGPRQEAVPTVMGVFDGQVHDPKAKVLGENCGSAGLFSTVEDLQVFLEHYLKDNFSKKLWQNYSQGSKTRSLGWNLDGDWIDHTGYTGPFIMANRKHQQAAIFLTNRTFAYDDRSLWIEKRRELRDVIKETLDK